MAVGTQFAPTTTAIGTPTLPSMRHHPISPVTEPMQYRAIGVVRGVYVPSDPEQLTRGLIRTADGVEIEAVVLGRLLTLMRRHLNLEEPHLWVVYPRSKEEEGLHLQMVGVWEPSTLAESESSGELAEGESTGEKAEASDQLPEGDDYTVVVQIRDTMVAKPKNHRVTFHDEVCGECKRAEYACICDGAGGEHEKH